MLIFYFKSPVAIANLVTSQFTNLAYLLSVIFKQVLVVTLLSGYEQGDYPIHGSYS